MNRELSPLATAYARARGRGYYVIIPAILSLSVTKLTFLLRKILKPEVSMVLLPPVTRKKAFKILSKKREGKYAVIIEIDEKLM